MLIQVRVTANAKAPQVTRVDDADFDVRVDEKAVEGRANKRLVEILADHFKVPRSRISIVRGAKSRDKVLQVAQ